MNRSLRIVRLSRRQAWPWRWELALLELCSQRCWRLPGAVELKAHALRLGQRMQAGEVPVVLAFDGYTLVGACWRDAECGDFGPHVIPGSPGVERHLLQALATANAGATAAPDQDRPGIAQVEKEARAAPMAVAASTSLG